ncbi:hypothetical protein ACJMK2_036442 [Sinanodonta woodiana]|uniref:Diphthine--ammonia ligase n=1 Tax=Sinanodonta woodiana TaxID=1069815 RepID=A0ABD3WH78_SINWO
MVQCVALGHEIIALANLKPKDKDETDSYMYQSVGHHAIELYADAMGLPLYRRTIEGSSIETGKNYTPTQDDEVEDLYELLKTVKEEKGIEAVSVGAILSDYQRIRVENVCTRLGLTPLAYLWRRDQTELLDEMIDAGINAVVIKVAAMGLLPHKHLGKSLQELRGHLHKMSQKYELNVCGEGGEYETFTLDCPLFKKRIVIDDTETVIHSADAFAPVGYINIKQAHLEDKQIDSALPVRPLSLFMKTNHSLMTELLNEEEIKALSHQPCLSHRKIRADYSVTPELPPSSTRQVANHVWITGIRACIQNGKSIEELTRAALETLRVRLEECHDGWSMSSLVLVHLYVRNMEDFAAINSVYKTFFSVNPACRVCVQGSLTPDIALQIDCYGYLIQTEKQTMHVQSLSHWAPANIGPYSQAIKINNKLYIAGQIAMIPSSLQIIEGGILAEARLSLRHVSRIIEAICPGWTLGNIVSVVCYVTQQDYIQVACSEWKKATEKHKNDTCHPCCMVPIVVPQLPKGALIEWQVTAADATEITDTRHNFQKDSLTASFRVCYIENPPTLSSFSCVLCMKERNYIQLEVRAVLTFFIEKLEQILSKVAISLSSLPLLRVFYPASVFAYKDLVDRFRDVFESADCDAPPVSIVPVDVLESEDAIITVIAHA